MRIIAIANQKGGVGKTTTATALATILNRRGKKTLLVDTDVQCNSTDNFRASIEGQATLFDLILDDDPCSVEEAIQHTPSGDIIAGDPQLASADSKLANTPGAFFRMRERLEGVKGYDYIIIDTNPSVNTMLNNSLVAADSVIIPVEAGRFAIAGLSQLINTIVNIKKYMNPQLRIEGMLITRVKTNTRFHQAVLQTMEGLAKSLDTKLFSTYIRESVKCGEAQGEGIPLIEYAPSCTTAQDYTAFVDELLAEEEKDGKN